MMDLYRKRPLYQLSAKIYQRVNETIQRVNEGDVLLTGRHICLQLPGPEKYLFSVIAAGDDILNI